MKIDLQNANAKCQLVITFYDGNMWIIKKQSRFSKREKNYYAQKYLSEDKTHLSRAYPEKNIGKSV